MVESCAKETGGAWEAVWETGDPIIGVIGAVEDGTDLLESVGEIGGDTVAPEVVKKSDGDFVVIGGLWAAEMLANNVWKDALADGE